MASCLPRPSVVCLRAQVSSNVRPRRAASSASTTLLVTAASSSFSLRSSLQDQFVVASRLGSGLAPDTVPRLEGTRRQTSSLKLVLQGRAEARPSLRLRRRLEPERRRALRRPVRSGRAGTRFTKGSSSHASARPQSGQNQETRASTPQRPDEARPNPSLNRTRYGKAAWPSQRQLVHCRCPGQAALPPRSG